MRDPRSTCVSSTISRIVPSTAAEIACCLNWIGVGLPVGKLTADQACDNMIAAVGKAQKA